MCCAHAECNRLNVFVFATFCKTTNLLHPRCPKNLRPPIIWTMAMLINNFVRIYFPSIYESGDCEVCARYSWKITDSHWPQSRSQERMEAAQRESESTWRYCRVCMDTRDIFERMDWHIASVCFHVHKYNFFCEHAGLERQMERQYMIHQLTLAV